MSWSKLTTEKVVSKARRVHGDKYDYSRAQYVSAHEKMIIGCPEHGWFEQSYANHVIGKQNCPKCRGWGFQPEDRFWKHVDKNGKQMPHMETRCWAWTGGKTPKGYGSFSVNGIFKASHRFSYELHFGVIPQHDSYHGLCVMHKCDNPECTNPDHLELGTSADNVHDKIRKGRDRNLKGEDHPNAKLTWEVVREIRRVYGLGVRSQKQLAVEYGMTRTDIWRIVHNMAWTE